jgi:hypothetical protein
MSYWDKVRGQARSGQGPGRGGGARADQGDRPVRAVKSVAAATAGRSWARILAAAGAAIGVAAALAMSAPSASAQPPYAYGAALAAITVADGNTVIAVQTPSNALLFYWNEYGTNTWHAEQVAASGTTFSAPTIAPDGDGVIIAAQGPRNSLDFYWQANGTTPWHPELVGRAGTTFSAPSLAVNGGGVNIVAQGPNNSLDFYWALNGTTTWHPQTIAGAGSAYSAPSIASNGGAANVAVQGPGNSLNFYWQANGTTPWHPELVGRAGTTYSAPAITANDGSANIAANGPDGLDFYWQANGTTAWHPELITGEDPGDNAAPSITTMNHGSGDGVCVLAPYLAEYCAINGTANWQAFIPCQPNCQLLAGSDPVITENNGSDNIAIFSINGDLLFYWDDSSGGHEELVASDVT